MGSCRFSAFKTLLTSIPRSLVNEVTIRQNLALETLVERLGDVVRVQDVIIGSHSRLKRCLLVEQEKLCRQVEFLFVDSRTLAWLETGDGHQAVIL